MPFLIAAFETVLGAEALAAAGAALAAEAALTAGAAGAVGATAGAEALGAAGVAAAVPEAAMGINAINPELFASAVNSGAVNPATAFNDIPGLADKLANLPAGQNLFDTNALAEANNFSAGHMANQGIMGNNPYAQITASNTSGPMAAAPLPAAGAPAPVPVPPAPPAAPYALDGSYVEATGSPDSAYFRSPTSTPVEPPGFLDKLSDTFSPLQKGFEKAQEFAKKNPLIAGPGLTALSRMVSSGSSMPDTTYNGPLSKYKLKNFKGNFANPRDYQYRRASGGIIDYKEGGTTETPLTHADMGIAVDTDPDTKYLNPVDAAKKRAKKLRDRYGISIPEMQAPTPINDVNMNTRTAAHGGIMQVKRFVEGEGVGEGPDPNAGEGGVGGLGTNAGEQPSRGDGGGDPNTAGGNYASNMANMANMTDAETGGGANISRTGGNIPGTRGTGLFGPGGPFGPANTGPFSPYSGPERFGRFEGGGYGGDSGVDTTPTTPTTPVTNIDDLQPQFVNPEMYRPTTNPLAHYAKYDNEDYNYLRTPSMAVRSSPFNNNAMAEVLATVNKAKGGDINGYAQGGMSSLGGYARGGMPRLLDGPGDGMSDNIPATINNRQPARLADGEFVVPADVVSHLGNGSTKAGSKRLHLMMDQVRKARTGNPKQGKRINPDKFMPR